MHSLSSLRSKSEVTAKKARVLIMDNSRTVGFMSSKVLETLGYDSKAISTPANFARVIAEYKPHVVLMDINLHADVNGIELAKLCDAHNIPFIFITTNTSRETLRAAAQANPHSIISKPASESTYRAHIEIALQNQELKTNLLADHYGQLTVLRDQLKQKTTEAELGVQQIEELTETNQHLIAATWREREMKAELQSTVNELTQSKAIIEKQNKKIGESINYAKRIQETIFPSEVRLQRHIPEALLYYKPKDVVSGDFPWIYRIGDTLILAAVDCTGHGVPGALMSIVGNFLLKQITQKTIKVPPSVILDILHVTLRRTLNRNAGRGVHDGMDVALCKINLKTWAMEYAGAHRPLLLFRDGKIEKFKGDRLAIGGYHSATKSRFSNTVIQLRPDDYIAIFTDGFPDQFGGPEDRKMGNQRIAELVSDIAQQPHEQRKTTVQEYFENWQGNAKQIDDVLFIGAKIPSTKLPQNDEQHDANISGS